MRALVYANSHARGGANEHPSDNTARPAATATTTWFPSARTASPAAAARTPTSATTRRAHVHAVDEAPLMRFNVKAVDARNDVVALDIEAADAAMAGELALQRGLA